MPTFPTYHGELPPCLNPLNLRHYFLLIYWIFFRPTALNCYLYQADAELYRGEKSGWMERERRFTLDDVQAVINSPELFRDGNAYFTGVWSQAEAPQHQVLKTLAPSVTGMTTAELEVATQLSGKELEAALEILKQHDVVRMEEVRWVYWVELMRRWVMSG